MLDDEIESEFPRLRAEGSYFITSPKNQKYNCVAWGVRDKAHVWQYLPNFAGYYWPPGIERDDTLESWIRVFEMHMFEKCDSRQPEEGYEKIVIFLGVDGEPSHVARQMVNGTWTSKLGIRGKDIIHRSVDALEGDIYGAIAQVMRRKCAAQEAHEIRFD